MSRKQKNTDDFRLNSLVKKGEKVLKKRNDFRTGFFFCLRLQNITVFS